LFLFHHSYVTSIWEKRYPEGEKMMHPCELPSLQVKKATTYPGYYMGVFFIPKKAKHMEAAVKLMQYLCSEETAEKWESYSKSPSGLKSSFSYNNFGKDKFGIFSQHISQKYNERLSEESLSSLLFNTQKELKFNVDKLLNAEITAEQAYNKLIEQL
jgi:spermidine/putrescine-binding protein